MKLKIRDVVDAALLTYEIGACLVRIARDELSGETSMPLSHRDSERQAEAARRAGPPKLPEHKP